MTRLTIFTARRIRTMDPGRPLASAVAVKDGKIVSVGSLDSMKPWLEREPFDVDERYAEKVIFPGFIDPHTHFRLSGVLMSLTYVGPIDQHGPNGFDHGVPSREAVLERLRAAANTGSVDEPIVAWGLDPAVQGGHLDRDTLDSISTTRPIWVLAYAPHVVAVNSPMLKRIGVDETTNVYGIERYPDGRLNGQFIELGAVHVAMRAVAQYLGRPTAGVEAIWALGKLAQSVGITATADMGFGTMGFETEWAEHQQVVNDEEFPMRMFLVPVEGGIRRAHGAASPQYLLDLKSQNTDKLAFHGVKFINDGSYPAMTLRLNYPGYLDGHEGHRGETPWDELFETMLPYWKAGVQIHSHANGDETVQMTLDVLERLQLAHPRFDHRFTIEHYCISTPAQARRLKALGGLASVNNYFVHFRSQLHSTQGYGPDRAEATARLGSLAREGVTFALHSDFSLVLTPISPLTAVWIAVNRIGLDGETVLAPGERIDVDRAMRAITVDAAHILSRDHVMGSIEAGKLADFTILDDDPYDVDPLSIRDIRVHGTVLGGKVFETHA